MSMTKAAIIAAARERADATRSGRWDDADLGIILGSLHWREWAHILNANNMYRTNTIVTTPNSAGEIATAALNDTYEFCYRVLSINDGGRYLAPIEYRQAPTPSQFGYGVSNGWYLNGNAIQIVPALQNALTIVVNSRPRKASVLDDTDVVEFIDGHEHVLVYGLAGEMLLKGGAETEAANDLFNFQRILREDMLSDIRRLSVRPSLMQAMDDPSDWGSQ